MSHLYSVYLKLRVLIFSLAYAWRLYIEIIVCCEKQLLVWGMLSSNKEIYYFVGLIQNNQKISQMKKALFLHITIHSSSTLYHVQLWSSKWKHNYFQCWKIERTTVKIEGTDILPYFQLRRSEMEKRSLEIEVFFLQLIRKFNEI